MVKKGCWLLVLFGFITLNITTLEARPKVAWFKSNANSGFWPIVERFLIAAAEDLNVELEIYGFEGNPVLLVKLVEDTLSIDSRRPDAILFHNEKGRGRHILELSHRYKVPAFLFNSGFKDSENIGEPRQFFPYWIGSMLPDDESAGYLLAQELHRIAKTLPSFNEGKPLQIVALEGNHTSEASNQRTLGLKRYLQNNPNLHLRQWFHSKWRTELAHEAFLVTRERYPETKIFWAASENMALGLFTAANEKGWVSGVDYVVGGIDLLPQNQPHVIKGKMAASVGGHYAEGAWSLIAIFDYLNGHDFADDEGVHFKTNMFHYTSQSSTKMGDLKKLISPEGLQQMDFKKYSKTYNPTLTRYDFTLADLLNLQGE